MWNMFSLEAIYQRYDSKPGCRADRSFTIVWFKVLITLELMMTNCRSICKCWVTTAGGSGRSIPPPAAFCRDPPAPLPRVALPLLTDSSCGTSATVQLCPSNTSLSCTALIPITSRTFYGSHLWPQTDDECILGAFHSTASSGMYRIASNSNSNNMFMIRKITYAMVGGEQWIGSHSAATSSRSSL